MNTYRALTPAAVGVFAEGVFERDFTPAEEHDWIHRGLIEIVPREYEVLTTNFAAGAQGDTVTLALLRENEQALLDGGHLARIETTAAKAARKKKG